MPIGKKILPRRPRSETTAPAEQIVLRVPADRIGHRSGTRIIELRIIIEEDQGNGQTENLDERSLW
jgi:hypothetical protein